MENKQTQTFTRKMLGVLKINANTVYTDLKAIQAMNKKGEFRKKLQINIIPSENELTSKFLFSHLRFQSKYIRSLSYVRNYPSCNQPGKKFHANIECLKHLKSLKRCHFALPYKAVQLPLTPFAESYSIT